MPVGFKPAVASPHANATPFVIRLRLIHGMFSSSQRAREAWLAAVEAEASIGSRLGDGRKDGKGPCRSAIG
jgi:hypothetical protein